jgi:hypothetical protein
MQPAKRIGAKRRPSPVPFQSVLSPLYLKAPDQLRPGAALRDWRSWWLARARQADVRLARARGKGPACVTTHWALEKFPMRPRDRVVDRLEALLKGTAFQSFVAEGVSPSAILAPFMLALDPYAWRAQRALQSRSPRRGRPHEPVVPHVVVLWAVAILWATGRPSLRRLGRLCEEAGLQRARTDSWDVPMWRELGRMLNHPRMLGTLDQAGARYVAAEGDTNASFVKWHKVRAVLDRCRREHRRAQLRRRQRPN